MKVRSDFVSNSSSSSFIISTRTPFDVMSKKILDLQPESYIKTNNFIALNYFIDKHTLFFFGCIPLFKYKTDEGTDFEHEWNVSAFDIMIKNDSFDFDYWLRYKDWYKPANEDGSTEKYSEDEAKAVFKKELLENLNNRAKYSDMFAARPECCRITKNTIDMTQAIIDCGINIEINNEKFELIKKALSEGKSVYYITMGDNGEGVDAERIFIDRNTGINVYDPYEFKKIIDCDILVTENEDEEIPE